MGLTIPTYSIVLGVVVVIQGLYADREVIVFLICWCKFRIFTMQNCYVYLTLVPEFLTRKCCMHFAFGLVILKCKIRGVLQ